MFKKIYYISLLVVLIYSCKVKNCISNYTTNCLDIVNVKCHKVYAKDKKENMVAEINKKDVVVFFEDSFNDRIKVYIKEKIVFNELLKTDESLGTTEKYFTYNYSNDDVIPKLKIELDSSCVTVNIKENYKLIYIYYYKKKWEIIYSNVYPTYE